MKHYMATDAGMIQEMNERMNTFNLNLSEPKQIESDMIN